MSVSFPGTMANSTVRKPGATLRLRDGFAALNMLGQQMPFTGVPGFWSDHHSFGLQTVGLLAPGARIIEREGGDGGFLLLYLDARARLLGASGWGAGNSVAKDIQVCERLIESQVALPIAQLADVAWRSKVSCFPKPWMI